VESRAPDGELEKHEWTKGDDFIVDFGGHCVGYLSFARLHARRIPARGATAACGSATCASRPSPTMPATFAHFALVKRCLYLFPAIPRMNASLPACVDELPAQRGASDYVVDNDALFGVTLAEYVRI
jgi:hypothetical protein